LNIFFVRDFRRLGELLLLSADQCVVAMILESLSHSSLSSTPPSLLLMSSFDDGQWISCRDSDACVSSSQKVCLIILSPQEVSGNFSGLELTTTTLASLVDSLPSP